jgi:hypothetical protein
VNSHEMPFDSVKLRSTLSSLASLPNSFYHTHAKTIPFIDVHGFVSSSLL